VRRQSESKTGAIDKKAKSNAYPHYALPQATIDDRDRQNIREFPWTPWVGEAPLRPPLGTNSMRRCHFESWLLRRSLASLHRPRHDRCCHSLLVLAIDVAMSCGWVVRRYVARDNSIPLLLSGFPFRSTFLWPEQARFGSNRPEQALRAIPRRTFAKSA
jgi:hypothetical protein